MRKVVLVDGNNLLFRSFFATSHSGVIMKNSKGFPTNALYGFINMLNKIIQEENPEYLLVALDKGKTFRHEKYEAYKGKREEMPEELKLQFPLAKKVMNALGVKYFEIDHYEADDIIGTFAQRIDESEDMEGLIVSSDKDLLQLITPKVKVKLLKQSGHIFMDEEEFRKTYQVDPIHMIDLKALMGDASDNIPGVKGIGEKTAIKLMAEYTTVENLYDHIDEVKGAVHDKLVLDKQRAFDSKDLATICKEVPIDFGFEEILYHGMHTEEYKEILQELEFYSLIKKMTGEDTTFKPTTVVKTERELVEIEDLNTIQVLDAFSLVTEIVGTNYHYDEVCGFALCTENKIYVMKPEVVKSNPHFFITEIEKSTYDVKKLMVVLSRYGVELNQCHFDSAIAGYLLNYEVRDDAAYLSQALGYPMKFYETVYGKNTKLKMPEWEVVKADLARKAEFVYETKTRLLEELKQNEQMYLFEQIEMPLARVLTDMETTGIRVDSSYLETFGNSLKAEFENIEKEIYELAGVEFNISSPKQLATVLFEGLKIPYPKKIKDNNYSTSKEILDKLTDYEIVLKVLRYRTLTKIYNTYCIGLLQEVHDGRVHTIFNQTLTKTGRLSSIAPNLQNIPIRLEEGKQVRKAFVPDEDSVLLSSDYSQVELRVFASLSHAENMILAFQNDDDIHAQTAADIFKVDILEVTKDMRRTAKAVNFGIIYGISSFGLSEDLKINVKEAKQFIDNYLETYPGVRKFMDETIEGAYRDGYVKTIMGRIRMIEELRSKNYMVRSSGERMALNTPIQGSAADILKKAMIDIWEEFRRRNLESKMLIQVHDELVFNVKVTELEEVKEIVREKMENVYHFEVPLKVDIEVGDTWYDAK